METSLVIIPVWFAPLRPSGRGEQTKTPEWLPSIFLFWINPKSYSKGFKSSKIQGNSSATVGWVKTVLRKSL